MGRGRVFEGDAAESLELLVGGLGGTLVLIDGVGFEPVDEEDMTPVYADAGLRNW